MPLQPLTLAEAISKARKYCAQEERCTRQVTSKLKSWKVQNKDILAVLEDLEREGFLNEERFARAFVRGKFNLNHWGRIQIRMHMKQLGISPDRINSGLEEIDDQHYMEELGRLLLKKNATIPTKTEKRTRQMKLVAFALSKGYERELIMEAMNRILKTDK